MSEETRQFSGDVEFAYFVDERVLPAAFALLPGAMATREARALLLAIGFQESEFRYRRQQGNGPARGFWQFERAGGVAGILRHAVVGPIVRHICALQHVEAVSAVCHAAIEHHDVLAACFARLLLYVDPRALPNRDEASKGWSIYEANWRPGKPRPQDWPDNFARAWAIINQ